MFNANTEPLATARAAGDGGPSFDINDDIHYLLEAAHYLAHETPCAGAVNAAYDRVYAELDIPHPPAWKPPHLATPAEAEATDHVGDANDMIKSPDALDREVAVARELARLHFDRREWWGACTKAERTAWLVEKYWPQWRNDAASIIALLAPAPTLKPGEAYMKATLDVPGNGTKP